MNNYHKPQTTKIKINLKEAMDDLLDDIERNTEAFEIEQRKV